MGSCLRSSCEAIGSIMKAIMVIFALLTMCVLFAVAVLVLDSETTTTSERVLVVGLPILFVLWLLFGSEAKKPSILRDDKTKM